MSTITLGILTTEYIVVEVMKAQKQENASNNNSDEETVLKILTHNCAIVITKS